eukprot:3332387-Rhodomonas_salina.1
MVKGAKDLWKHYKSWTSGGQVSLDAEIEWLKDNQLGRCLAHHNLVFKMPVEMYPGDWRVQQDCFVMARRCTSSKNKFYLDCQVMEPVSHAGRTIQLP